MTKTKPKNFTADQEQRWRDCMVRVARRILFYETEADAIERMEWMALLHVSVRDGIDLPTATTELSVVVEEHAIKVKPLALEIVLRAKKAGPSDER